MSLKASRTFVLRGETWGVVYCSEAQFSDFRKKGLRGTVWRRYRRIYINTDQPIAVQRRTLLHEVLHVACNDLTLPAAIEEAFVEAIEVSLFQVLEALGVTWPA